METMTFRQQKILFDRLSDVESYDNLSHEDKLAYDADLKAYRDITGQLAFAEAKGFAKGFVIGFTEGFTEGFAEGFAEGLSQWKVEIVRKMRNNGFDDETIARLIEEPVEWVKGI